MRLDLNMPMPMSRAAAHAEVMIKSRSAQNNLESARLNKVAEEFETLLLENMMKEMRATVPESPIFGQSRSQEIFNELLDGEFARLMGKKGGIGIADYMTAKMNRNSPVGGDK